MQTIGRRAALRAAVSLSVTTGLARPYLARAEARTATVWAGQGFVPEEDAAFRKTVADYEKLSGNRIDYSIMPFTALNQKAISALTSGVVPDLIFHGAPETILPQNAWDDRLLDVSDVVEPLKDKLSATSLLCSSFYNSRTRRRSYYLVPVKQASTPFHIWGHLVRKAGFDLKDAPKTWDAFWDFFKPMQKALRSKGMRRLYCMGMQVTTVGPNDGNNLFSHFMIANGGQDIVTSDGRLHTEDPAIREAAIRSLTYMTTAYKEGYVPPEALSWNDADDNNGYHEKLFLMDFDGTLSTELALAHNKEAYFEQMAVMGLPNRNDGKPMAAQVGAGGGFIPKGASNVAVAKDFMKYFMQPQVANENLKGGLGRWVPVIPSIVREDPWWQDPKDPFRAQYVQESVLNPTIPSYNGFNPAWGQVNAEQLWGGAIAAVVREGLPPAEAVDHAFRRMEEIFTRYVFS